ncbi:MAG: hypothetical protein R2827_15040 [Bdellovibrionales bacterium]
MKKILFLGAARFQTPAIEYALEAGYRVITLDNRPQNPGHAMAHKAFNDISITEVDRVLEVAKSENIDGVLSFGSDVGALTEATVAHHMKLPGNPISTIELLTNKGKFRRFLEERNLQKPITCIQVSESDWQKSIRNLNFAELKYIVKPLDSSGSKGVSIVEDPTKFEEHLKYAFVFSRSRQAVVEEYLTKTGFQICGDGFFEKGQLKFIHFGDGHFYEPKVSLAPFAETFPSTRDSGFLNKVETKLQSVLKAAGFIRGSFNLDVMVLENGEPFIIEIGPRAGGNYIPSAIKYATGVDVVGAAVESALNLDFSLNIDGSTNHCVASYMVHSFENINFKGFHLSSEVQGHVLQQSDYLTHGEELHQFKTSSHVCSNILLRFDDQKEMLDTITNMRNHLEFNV